MLKINLVRQLLAFFKKWFWIKPTEKDSPPKASDVIDNYVCIRHKGQLINLRNYEVEMFHKMNRTDKRAMANKFAIKEKKGLIEFKKINGKMTCIKKK